MPLPEKQESVNSSRNRGFEANSYTLRETASASVTVIASDDVYH